MPVQTWNFDYQHSSINFVARHLVVARVFGRFDRFQGMLEADPADLNAGAVEVRIDATSVNTFNVDRDNHLRSADFLDVADFRRSRSRAARSTRRVGARSS